MAGGLAVFITRVFVHDRVVGPVQNPQPGGLVDC